MNPLVEQVLRRQLRSIRWIYAVIVLCVLGVCTVAIVIGSPVGVVAAAATLAWVEWILGGLGLMLLVLVIPLARRRLIDPARVRNATRAEMEAWGVPEGVDSSLGRQAVFLTRYTAGCVIAWGLGASVGLYGLVVRMLGSAAPVTAAFLAASVFVTFLFPPRGNWVREVVRSLSDHSRGTSV